MGAMVSPISPLLACTLVVGLGTLAACSDDDSTAPAGTASASASASGETDEGGSEEPAPAELPAVPKINRAQGAADDLRWQPETCGTEAGGQVVRGRVVNPTKRSAAYLVTVSWVEGSQVVTRGSAVVRRVPAGVGAPWKIRVKLSRDADQCVVNVRRGVIAAAG